jgi:hypothetical protein
MGIDIYAKWHGQTDLEESAQISGFSVLHGHLGYLREAYHGQPYATKHLCREAFESDGNRVRIPAAVLRERLPETLRLADERERTVYRETDEAEIGLVLKSFRDFVELCERKERETGEPVLITASY